MSALQTTAPIESLADLKRQRGELRFKANNGDKEAERTIPAISKKIAALYALDAENADAADFEEDERKRVAHEVKLANAKTEAAITKDCNARIRVNAKRLQALLVEFGEAYAEIVADAPLARQHAQSAKGGALATTGDVLHALEISFVNQEKLVGLPSRGLLDLTSPTIPKVLDGITRDLDDELDRYLESIGAT